MSLGLGKHSGFALKKKEAQKEKRVRPYAR